MLWKIQKHGVSTSTFFYSVTFEDVPAIEARLKRTIAEIASRGEYVLVGHSLGGVLIRSVVASLPKETRLPNRVFLLGSPMRPSRIAKYLSRNWLFQLATRDCGHLLSSDSRMEQIPPCPVPTTSFVGTSGSRGSLSPFGNEINDGIVAATEVAADWISEEVTVPVGHSWMPSSHLIAKLIIERIEADRSSREANATLS